MARAKTPRFFRRPVRERAYRRRLGSRIYLESDRSFLSDITTTDDAGRIVLSRELSPDEVKRVNALVKTARKNHGAIRRGKLVVFALLIGAVIVFNVVFKDRIVERAAQSFLENLFDARVELSGLRFRPIRGEIRFDSVVVADAREPMTNLFELGIGALEVDTWQLIQGYVRIEEMTVAGLAFGTPRTESGALERGDPPRGDEAIPVVERTPFTPPDLGLPTTLDARAFIDEHRALITTPDEVERIIDAGADFVSERTADVTALARAAAGTFASVTDFANTDFAAVRSPDRALELYQRASELYVEVSDYRGSAERLYADIANDSGQIISAASRVPTLVQRDYERLVAMIPDVRAEGRDFVARLIEPHLRATLGVWYDRIALGYTLVERLRRDGSDSEPVARVARTGRILDFGLSRPPRFLLRQAFLSSTGVSEQRLVITELSSDQSRSGAPTTIAYDAIGVAGGLSLGAVFDLRPGAAASLAANAAATSVPLLVDRGFDALGLDAFAGSADLEVSLVQTPDRASGGAALGIADARFSGTPADGGVGAFVRDVVGQADRITAEFGYSIDQDRSFRFTSASTNLDEAFVGVLQQRIDATVARFRSELEDALIAYLDPELERLSDALGGVIDVRLSAEELVELARDRQAAIARIQDRSQNLLTTLRDGIEAEARARIDAAQREAEAAAAAAAERARQEAEQARREAEAAATAEAERIRQELEEAARREAEEAVRNRIRLPGF
ncbi:MAG: hypothetical protein EA382_14410 [Spirochaetaceae bacterium]|nr:MAG: hypothetical protein EA382_14410 [Spirochaetaceae bacterium]